MKELTAVPPAVRTVLIGMKPDASVGMSAKNSTRTVKPVQVPAGSTTRTVAPSPAGAPVGGLTNGTPPAVIVAIIRIDAVWLSPVSGFVQLVDPSHCIAELENDVNVMVCSEPSKPALGNALGDVPQ